MIAAIRVATEATEKLQTHSAWWPEWYEILFGSIAFVAVGYGGRIETGDPGVSGVGVGKADARQFGFCLAKTVTQRGVRSSEI